MLNNNGEQEYLGGATYTCPEQISVNQILFQAIMGPFLGLGGP